AGCPQPPDVRVVEADFTPAEYNDPDLTARCTKVFEGVVGKDKVTERRPSMGGEDFSRYSREAKGVQGFMFWLGSVEQGKFAASQKPGGPALPTIHSASYQPDPAPTIRTGVRCMTAAAQSLLAKK